MLTSSNLWEQGWNTNCISGCSRPQLSCWMALRALGVPVDITVSGPRGNYNGKCDRWCLGSSSTAEEIVGSSHIHCLGHKQAMACEIVGTSGVPPRAVRLSTPLSLLLCAWHNWRRERLEKEICEEFHRRLVTTFFCAARWPRWFSRTCMRFWLPQFNTGEAGACRCRMVGTVTRRLIRTSSWGRFKWCRERMTGPGLRRTDQSGTDVRICVDEPVRWDQLPWRTIITFHETSFMLCSVLCQFCALVVTDWQFCLVVVRLTTEERGFTCFTWHDPRLERDLMNLLHIQSLSGKPQYLLRMASEIAWNISLQNHNYTMSELKLFSSVFV